MSTAKEGNTVKINYKGTLQDGSVFDSSEGREALEFKLGEGLVIPGFENAITGMAIGETKTVVIPVEEAYGPRREEMAMKVDKQQVPADLTPEVGMQLGLSNDQNQTIPVTITEVGDDYLILDGNHPLAGQELTFEIELLEVA